MEKKFTLTPAEAPQRGAQRRGVYYDVLSDFQKMGVESVLVSIPDTVGKTVQIGLAKAIRLSGFADTYRAIIRDGKVYLVRNV